MVVSGILILVAVVSSLVYFNRARLLNETLAILVAPFRVSVGDIDFHRIGEVRIRDLQLTPKNAPEGTLLASVPETVITYRLQELRATRKLGTIELRQADILFNDAILAAMKTTEAAPAVAGAPEGERFSLATLAFFTEFFTIRDSRITIDLEDLPRVEASWKFRSGALELDESGLNREAVELELTHIEIGEDAENGRIARLAASGRMSPDFSRLRIDAIRIDRPELRLTPALFPEPAPASSQPGQGADSTGLTRSGSAAAKRTAIDLFIQSLTVSEGSIALTGFDGKTGRPALPDLFFDSSFSFRDLSFTDGKWGSGAPLSFSLTNVALGRAPAQLLSGELIDVQIDDPGALVQDRIVSALNLKGMDLIVSDNSLQPFRTSNPAAAPGDAPDAIPPGGTRPWVLEKVTLENGSILMQDLTIDGAKAPHFETAIQGTLEQLRLGGDGFQSDGLQSIVLEGAKLRAPESEAAADPIFSLERAEMTGRWSDFQKENRIDRLAVRGPKIHFTDAALGRWLDSAGVIGEDEPRPVNRPVYEVSELDVTGGRLTADSSFAVGKVPKIYSGFSLKSAPATGEAPVTYHLQMTDFEVRNHPRLIEAAGPPVPPTLFPKALEPREAGPLSEAEVFSVKQIEVDFTAAQLQRTRRIGKLKMSGALLTVGEGLKAIATPGSEPEKTETGATPAPVTPAPANPPNPAVPTVIPEAGKASPPSAGGRLPAWLFEEVEITGSQVRFEALIPQVEGLQFAIETRLNEVPLSLDGLLAQEKLQKIELAGIEIKDPYDSFITVALLPTIFVEFSLAGLARQEIEKIDLIGPSLYVGQGLFWWIDYQRNFREQNEGASVGIQPGVAVARKPDWVIKTINATAGKIVISPTGVPIGIVPFPFNATTNMTDGKIELKLNIPDEDHVYRFPDYKVDLYGLTGDVQFNVPVQNLNNNLVQTFTLKRAVWKEHEAKELYITVTFDGKGIYGQFGGASYGGYAKGQFNFYLDDPGKWDAWVTGTEMDTGPLTKVIVPDTFLMEGRVSLKVISEGRDKIVGETTGEFQTTTKGWFDVTKLDKILEELPPEWTTLQRSLAELSLVALKRFDYDKGTGSLYFRNREGALNLRFAGDYGSRELNLHLHDDTKTNQQSAARIKVSGDEIPTNPLPEASARPVQPAATASAGKRESDR